jgi:uncharacterized protein (DUF1919 family)
MIHSARSRLAAQMHRAAHGWRRRVLRARLQRRDFTIVSNNCWGSHLYQDLGIPYQTPTIGLFFAPSCYLKLCGNFRKFMASEIRFKAVSSNEFVNAFRESQKTNYPIGVLGDDVEIQFLHYESEAAAAAAWERRAARITADDDGLFFKFDDRGGCTVDELRAFERLPLARKVCFVSGPVAGLNDAVVVPTPGTDGVPDGVKLSWISPNYFDAAGWINGKSTRPRPWPLRCG